MDPKDNKEADNKEAEVKEVEPTKLEPESTKTPEAEVKGVEYYNFTDSSGVVHQATESECNALMQLGYDAALKTQEKVPEKTVDAATIVKETAEDKADRLEQEFKTYKQENKIKEDNAANTAELEQAINSTEFLKENPHLVEGVRLEALARQSVNSRYSLTDTVKQATADRMKIVMDTEKKNAEQVEATAKIQNAMGGSTRSTGNTSKIDPEKKYTIKDVRTGVSRDALEGYFERQLQGE